MDGWAETIIGAVGGAGGMKVLEYLLGRRQKRDDVATKLRDDMLVMAREIIEQNTKGLREQIASLERRIGELEDENRQLRAGVCAQCSFRAK